MIELIEYLYGVREQLPLFTLYDHPADYPDVYIARLWLTLPEARPTDYAMTCESVEPIREQMINLGLTRLERAPEDDPSILETWI